MKLTDDVFLMVIALMAVITFLVARRVLDKTVLGGNAIPLAVAGLAFLGLWKMDRSWIEFILLEYAALAVVLLVIICMALFFRKTSSTGKPSDTNRKPWTPFKGY